MGKDKNRFKLWIITDIQLNFMRKLLFVLVTAFLFAGTTMAQLPIQKNNFFVNANLSDCNISFGNFTTITIGVYGGTFIEDRVAITGGLDLYSIDSYNYFNFAAGVRLYFAEKESGSFFATGLLDIRKSKYSDAVIGLRFNGGHAFFLNQSVALEPMATLWLPFSKGYDMTLSLGAGFSVYF